MESKYNYLKEVTAPKVIGVAMRYYGIHEIKGRLNNQTIMSWAKDLGIKDYTADEIPWCGLFVARVVTKAGYNMVSTPLWARSWVNFGTKQTTAMLGDILVFSRDGGGHVGFYVAEDPTYYHVLGGNQSDSVCIKRIAKNRCIGIRRCPWKYGQPAEVKQYRVVASGAISTNER